MTMSFIFPMWKISFCYLTFLTKKKVKKSSYKSYIFVLTKEKIIII